MAWVLLETKYHNKFDKVKNTYILGKVKRRRLKVGNERVET